VIDLECFRWLKFLGSNHNTPEWTEPGHGFLAIDGRYAAHIRDNVRDIFIAQVLIRGGGHDKEPTPVAADAMTNCGDHLRIAQRIAPAAGAPGEIDRGHTTEEDVVDHYLSSEVVAVAGYTFGNRSRDVLSARDAGRIGWNRRGRVSYCEALSDGTGRGHIANENEQYDQADEPAENLAEEFHRWGSG
jgi:hypothetical protein